MPYARNKGQQVSELPPNSEWRLVGSQRIDGLPTHSALRFSFANNPTVEILTPRAVVNDDHIAHVASLLLERPPPPSGQQP